MLPIALGLGLVILLAAGRGSEVEAERDFRQTGPTPPPGPEPTKELSPMALERKRIIVQKGFLAAEGKRLAWVSSTRKNESAKATKNAVAAYFRSRNIPLSKPNPSVPFWAMPEGQIANYISKAVNEYRPMDVQIGPAKIEGYNYPTYVGAGRPRGPGLEYQTEFDTEFDTEYQMGNMMPYLSAENRDFQTYLEMPPSPISGPGTEYVTTQPTDFNTEFNTAFHEAYRS